MEKKLKWSKPKLRDMKAGKEAMATTYCYESGSVADECQNTGGGGTA